MGSLSLGKVNSNIPSVKFLGFKRLHKFLYHSCTSFFCFCCVFLIHKIYKCKASGPSSLGNFSGKISLQFAYSFVDDEIDFLKFSKLIEFFFQILLSCGR